MLSDISSDDLRLTQQELEGLTKIGQVRRFRRGDTVIWQGDEGDALYVIVAGSAKVYSSSEDGRARILRIIGAREIFGEIALLDGRPRSATVETLEWSRMCVVPRAQFERHVRRHPEILARVQQIVCARLRMHTSEILDLSFQDVEQRLIRLFLHLAERFGEARDGCVVISPPLSQRDLAGLLGCHRETVTRSLGRLQERGRVATRGRKFHIPSVKRLEEEVRAYGSESA